MFKEEVKENLLALLNNSHHEWIEKDYYELYIQKVDIDRLTDILMNGVIGDLLRERDEEIKQRERFAEQEGFTPDCSPYFIAFQYKKEKEVAERALYNLAKEFVDMQGYEKWDIAILAKEIVVPDYIKQSEKELAEESGEKKEV